MIITIDGPAGAGKSTVAKNLASKLGFTYIDTGAMYRALALKLINSDINPDDKEKVLELLENTSIELIPTREGNKVILDGEDVSDKIRTEEIGKITSKIAVYPEVRQYLVKLQRKLGKKYGNVVIEGRDTGTVIFPDAEIKLFLTASLKERAKRRKKQLEDKGLKIDLNKLIKDIEERDKRDMSRKETPLKPAKDAIIIDTTDLSLEQVLDKIVEIVNKHSLA